MPVLGHAFAGLVLGETTRPSAPGRSEPPAIATGPELWLPAVVTLAYLPDIVAQLGLIAGWSDGRLPVPLVIGLYKTEEIHRRGPWKGVEDAEFATLEWLAWYNTSRLLEPVGYVSPNDFERAYYDRQPAPASLGGTHVTSSPESPARCTPYYITSLGHPTPAVLPAEQTPPYYIYDE
jgi:hypothetical protein